MDTFNRIKAKIGLKIDEKELSGNGWLSERLKEHLDELLLYGEVPWFTKRRFQTFALEMQKKTSVTNFQRLCPILIQAPTGSGKNQLVLKTLAPIVEKQGGRVLLLTNRTALTLQ